MGIPSAAFMDRLKTSEGFRSRPYLCPAGFVTIGYGHNLESRPAPIRLWNVDLAAMVASRGIHGTLLLERLKRLGMAWTESDAEDWLAVDVSATMDEMSARCPAYRHLANIVAAEHAGKSEKEGASSFLGAQAQTRAEVLLDMAFNLGVGGLLGFRRMLSHVEQDDFDGAAMHMMASKWAGQVGKRAVELARHMRSGVRDS